MAQQQMAQQAYRVRLQQQQMAQSQREQHAALSGAPYFLTESRGEAGSLGALRPGLGAGPPRRPSGLSSGSLSAAGMMGSIANSMDGANGRASSLSSSELGGQSLPGPGHSRGGSAGLSGGSGGLSDLARMSVTPGGEIGMGAGGMQGMAQMGSFGDLGVANGYASFAQTAAFYAQPGRYVGGQLSGTPLLSSMQRSRSRNDSDGSMAGMSAAMGMQGMQGLGGYPNVFGNPPGMPGMPAAAMGGFGSGGNLYGRTVSNTSAGAERALKKSRQRSISGNGVSTGWLNALVGNDIYAPGMPGPGHTRSFSGSDPHVRNFSEGSSSGDHALAAVAANAAAAVAAAGADVRRRSSDLSTTGSGGGHSRASSASELEAAAGLSSLVGGGRKGNGAVNVSGVHRAVARARVRVLSVLVSGASRCCRAVADPHPRSMPPRSSLTCATAWEPEPKGLASKINKSPRSRLPSPPPPTHAHARTRDTHE